MPAFINDYTTAAHPAVLEAIARINTESKIPYGGDHHCALATEKIREATGCPEAEVFYLVGGTQTNQIAIDTLLDPFEGVVSAVSGHISSHEAGAIEFSGHKVITLPEHDGKICPRELQTLLDGYFADENLDHVVEPGMVYLSHPTEFGTLYSKPELSAIAEICRRYEMPLYMDGARLGYALACPESDLTLHDIAELCDAFYIGGTKVGALFGEALVFTKGNMPKKMLSRVKQHGALLAKGWLLGVQFETLFTDDLYKKVGENAIARAAELRAVLQKHNLTQAMNSPTNQIFVTLPDAMVKALAESVDFSFWEKVDEENTTIRFVTDWSTTPEMVRELDEALNQIGL
ncbi:MAG: low specificity L-threonine aldolase [Clostridia bacterium]|nr:low specificity L-threonine aldolase [Clostridia bacterium]MBQ4623435.1 low specificity L-threonine aldolase [Clostridia bacterium]